MTEYAKLVVSVDSRQVKDADRDMQGMTRSAGALSGGIGKLIAPVVSLSAAVAALNKAVSVQRQFDVLNAGLITATGSTENAAEAFQALQSFAEKTPYSLDQAVEGFTKLVNLGLTPSEKALLSYGNTASSMGKDLSQMIEAVADASTGEFERLKEFGIRAKAQGDQVSFTFQGVTTKVRNNAAEIEKYLTALGENQFAGAMERRMDTLDGAISNLGDTFDTTVRLINDAGLGSVMEDAVRVAITALDDLNGSLASGQLEGYLDAIAGKFDGFGRDIDETFKIITEIIGEDTGRWDALLRNNVDTMIATFRDLPENVRAFIQIMVVEVLSGFDRVTAYSKAFKEGIEAIFSSDTLEGVGQRLADEIALVDQVRQNSIESILSERDAALNSFDSQITAADGLRKSYDEMAASGANAGDRLARFAVDVAAGGEAAGEVSKEVERLLKLYDSTEQGLSRQVALFGQITEAARVRYELENGELSKLSGQQKQHLLDLAKELDAKQDLITQDNIRLDILRETGQLRAANDLQFELDYAQQIAEYERQGNVEALQRLETLRQIREVNSKGEVEPGTVEGVTKAPSVGGLDAEVGGASSELVRLEEEAQALESWRAAELEKQAAFLEAKAINEETYQARIDAINQQGRDGQAKIERAKNQAVLTSSEEFFGQMAVLSRSGNKELGAIGKAAAIAQATISGFTAIQNALAVPPYPVGLALAVSAGVMTAANIASIAGVGFKTGGYTGNGGVNDVAGVVHGKEFVFDAAATSRIGVDTLEALRRGQMVNPVAGSQAVNQNRSTTNHITINQSGFSDAREASKASAQTRRDVVRALRSFERYA